MDDSIMMHHRLKTTILEIVSAVLFAAFCFGCASTPPAPPPPDKQKLAAAGFKVVDAKTQLQQERIQALPQGRVTWFQVTGQTYYVYPDPAKKQLYIGTQKEYDTYRLLYPNAGADSLAKQNARMRINTNNDLTDPWSLWDHVEGLGGR